MITQSLHFGIIGQDTRDFLLRKCPLSTYQEQEIKPMILVFENFLKKFTKPYQQRQDDELRAKKLAYAGVLSHLANPKLMALEERAVEMAIREKYGLD